MAKKTKEITSTNVSTGTDLVFDAADSGLAEWLGLDLSASANVRIERAVFAYNMATRNMVEAGVQLASVKAEVSQEEFIALVEERGMHKVRAYELMRGAAFAARLPADQREQVLALPKTKVLALASASGAVVEAMLEDGEVDIDLIGVRELRQRIRELEAGITDVTVQRDTAETELEIARKKLAKKPGDREDKVPLVVADLRAESVALTKKIDLSLESFNSLGSELGMLLGTEAASEWTDATARLIVAGLISIRIQLDGLVRKFAGILPDDGNVAPVPMSYLSDQEVLETAKSFNELIALHAHEKALRDWERDQAKPRGKGRPSAKPEAPKAGA